MEESHRPNSPAPSSQANRQRQQGSGLCVYHQPRLPDSLLDEAFEWSRRFFALSEEDKLKAPHPEGWAVHRGYSWPGLEKVSQAMSEGNDEERIRKLREVTDFKLFHSNHSSSGSPVSLILNQESYDMGSDENKDQPNQWIPEDVLPQFQEFITRFYWECFGVASHIMRALALGIGLDDEDHLVKRHSGHNNQLRLLHYPPLPAEALENESMSRMPAHTDWSSMTMLFQDDCGGLEVEDLAQPGSFIPVTPVKNAIIMNVGDLLQRWSNGMFLPFFHSFAPQKRHSLDRLSPIDQPSSGIATDQRSFYRSKQDDARALFHSVLSCA